MGHVARKKKRNSPPPTHPGARKAAAGSSPHRLALAIGILLLASGLAWYGFRTSSSLEPPVHREPPPESPPIDTAQVLGLSNAVPENVDGLRNEINRVCENLVRDLPQRPEAHSVAALTKYHYGLKDEALEAWEQASRLNRGFSPAQLGIGLVAADKGQDRQAIAALQHAIELNPSNEEAYAKLVEVLLRENEGEKALEVGSEFARRFPDSRKATYWLGQTYLQLERYEEAVAAHEKVIRHHPDLTPSYYSLALALARLGRREEAAEMREKFAKLKEKDLQKERDQNRNFVDLEKQTTMLADTHLSAGNVYLSVGELTKAEAHWLRGAQVRRDNRPCRRALAALYESQKRWRSLAAVAAELVKLEPDDATAWLQLADARRRLGATEQAETAFRQAIAIDPGSAAAYSGLLRLGLETNHLPPDGIALARRAVELEPSADSYLLLSTALDQSGDRPGALVAIKKAMHLAPGEPQLEQIYRELRENR